MPAKDKEQRRITKQKWVSRNLEHIAASVRAYNKRRRGDLIQQLGGCCKKCGYCKNMAALDFHHIDPATKKKQVRDWMRLDFDVSTVVLLCRNCHAEVEHPELEIQS